MDQIVQHVKDLIEWIKDLFIIPVAQIKPKPNEFLYNSSQCPQCYGIGTIGIDKDSKYYIRCGILAYFGYKIYSGLGVTGLISLIALIATGLAYKDMQSRITDEQQQKQSFLSSQSFAEKSWYYFKEVFSAMKLASQNIYNTYISQKHTCTKCNGTGYIRN